MNHVSTRPVGFALWIAAALLAACAPSPESTPTVTPAVAPQPSTEAVPLLKLKIASYNILVGAGHDRSYDDHIPEEFRGIDRTPLLMEYLRNLDADIVGLQETTGWDEGTPPYGEVLADELGLNYFVSSPRSDSSLLTKFEILEAEDLSTPTTSIIRARLRGPDGEPVNVYVAHLNGDSLEERSCSTQFLLREMDSFADQRTFLVGDLNFKGKGGTEWSPKALRDAGWQLLALDHKLGLDQIWAPESLTWDATAWTAARGNNLKQLSDHSPVGMELLITSPSGEERTPLQTSPVPTLVLPELPGPLAGALSGAGLAFSQQEGVPCNEQRWNPYSHNANIVGPNLHLYGQEEWQSYANWSRPISEGEGMLLDFKFEPGSQFNIFLEHGDWAMPDFRKFGMVLAPDGQPHPDIWIADQRVDDPAWSDAEILQPATWYRLALLNAGEGRLGGYLWPVDDPQRLMALRADLGADWIGVPLRLATGANSGAVDIQQVGQIVFDQLQ